LGISQWYAGTAIVEQLNVDRLFSDASDKAKAEDYVHLKKSARHLRQASEHWETASSACAAVAAMVAATAEGRLLKEDIEIFQKLTKGARDLASQMEKGVLPPSTPVHVLTGLMRDQDVMAERRARAYQGLPGHLPKGYV
jgi:hypothetical protein